MSDNNTSTSRLLRSENSVSVILITGLPCSGKTTLARHMGQFLKCQVLSKDDFKEVFATSKDDFKEALAPADAATRSRTLGIAAEEALMQKSMELVTSGASHVVESVFRPEHIHQYLRDVTSVASLTIVVLRCDRDVLMDRFRKRERHAVHNDAEFIKSFPALLEIDADAFREYTTNVVEIDTTEKTDSILADELSYALATHL